MSSRLSHLALVLFVFTLAAVPSWAKPPALTEEISAARAYHVADRPLVVNDESASGGLTAVDRVELANGEVRKTGERLLPGDVVVRGVLVNRGRSALTLGLDDGRALRVGGSDLVLVGEATGVVPVQTCSVSCGTGYYACCKGNTFTPVSCSCIPEGTFELGCVAGGRGSTSCSITLP